MREFLVDLSDGSCYAGCGHCRHARRRGTGFTEVQIETYRRIEEYCAQHGKTVSLALTNVLHDIPDLSFVSGATSVAFPLHNVKDLLDGKRIAATVQRLLVNCGDQLTQVLFHPRYDPGSEQIDDELLILIFQMQVKLSQQLQKKEIHVGLNANALEVLVQEVQMDMLRLGMLYQKIGENMFPEARRTYGVSIDSTVLEFWSQVCIDDSVFGLGGRFINIGTTSRAPEVQESRDDRLSRCCLALFPWGVHLDHSTLNINDLTLKFSHEDFVRILEVASATGQSIQELLYSKVDARRKKSYPSQLLQCNWWRVWPTGVLPLSAFFIIRRFLISVDFRLWEWYACIPSTWRGESVMTKLLVVACSFLFTSLAQAGGVSSYGIPAENFGSIAPWATFSGDVLVFGYVYANGPETLYLMRPTLAAPVTIEWPSVFGGTVPVPSNADGIVLWLSPSGHVGNPFEVSFGGNAPTVFAPTVPGSVVAPFPGTLAQPFSMSWTSTGAEGDGLSATILGFYTAPVPEPEVWAMLLAGLGILLVSKRRKFV